MSDTPSAALSGIRVLDFTRVLAGPLCTMMLGDLGADVIKIENPTSGDETRTWGPPWAGDPEKRMSAYFLCVNRNKRSLSLNLKSPEGQRIAQDLATNSHIIIENMKPGQMAKFGLDYEIVKEINPAAVYCSITGFGQTGLYHERPGYDFVIQGMSGLMAITGPPEDAPYKVGVAVSDVFTALYACNAIQAALRHAEKTGEGQYIDMALYDSQLAALVNISSNYLVSGQNPQRYGNQHANIVPYQAFKASDGEFVLAVGNDRQFTKLCDLLGHPEWANNPAYATNPMRVKNRETLIPRLQAEFIKRPVQAWVDDLLKLGIPAGPINSVEEALNDPHTESRHMIESVHLADGTLFHAVASPMHLIHTPPKTRLSPPELGQHTEEILHEILDLDAEAIQALKATHVI